METSLLVKKEMVKKSVGIHTHIHFKNWDNTSVNQKLSKMRSNEFHCLVHTCWIA